MEQNCRGSTNGQFLRKKGIEWIRIVEYAPWRGGFYERLNREIKNVFTDQLDVKHFYQGKKCEPQ